VDPTTISVTVARRREDVFEYLADIANHAEFTDHFLVDWHLLREDTYGEGAGARFRIKIPLNRFDWADVSFIEVEAPYRIVERGRTGKYNRIRTLGEYRLTPLGSELTKVEFTFESAPGNLADRIMESFGARSWLRRKNRKALRRLRAILEEDRLRGKRPTLAGG
jgi:uncharacterized protein YndB with AHSA1/START domain